jgi:Ser/Thr protein kinase RdoA (MazF antagonist)
MDGAVYEFPREGQPGVLKLTPAPAEAMPIIHEKLEFVHFLGESGVRVAAPLPSPQGELIEVVREGEASYAVSMMLKAPGKHPVRQNGVTLDSRLIRAWGQVMGQMHALTQRYPRGRVSPEGEGATTRIGDWRAEFRGFRDWCKDDAVRTKWLSLGEELEKLPIARDGFGLIHNDLHQWNMLVEGDTVTVIDFDVCGYHWFMTDLGIALFHALWEGMDPAQETPEAFARRFLGEFLEGYSAENTLDRAWFRRMPIFLRYRLILLYIVFSNEWGASGGTGQKEMLRGWRKRIVSDTPILDMDFG